MNETTLYLFVSKWKIETVNKMKWFQKVQQSFGIVVVKRNKEFVLSGRCLLLHTGVR